MRTRDRIVATGVCLGAMAVASLTPRSAEAQAKPPIVTHDSNWGAVSNIAMVIGAGAVTVMPRVYYSDPESTVGWKGRWHFSVIAPAMTMTALTLFIDTPIRNAIKSTRPSCNQDVTASHFPGSGCESYGGPSTQSYAAWGATGSGLGIFLVDTLKYSDSRFNVPYFLGDFVLPLTAAVITSIGRGVTGGGTDSFESGGRIVAGALPGFFSGMLVGIAYSMWQHPNCGYGNSVFCW